MIERTRKRLEEKIKSGNEVAEKYGARDEERSNNFCTRNIVLQSTRQSPSLLYINWFHVTVKKSMRLYNCFMIIVIVHQ